MEGNGEVEQQVRVGLRTATDLHWIHNAYPRCYPLHVSKDAGMRIRVEKDLRSAFVQACRAQDRPAAVVLREFMRAFALTQLSGQASLFANTKQKPNDAD